MCSNRKKAARNGNFWMLVSTPRSGSEWVNFVWIHVIVCYRNCARLIPSSKQLVYLVLECGLFWFVVTKRISSCTVICVEEQRGHLLTDRTKVWPKNSQVSIDMAEQSLEESLNSQYLANMANMRVIVWPWFWPNNGTPVARKTLHTFKTNIDVLPCFLVPSVF